ncbi:MAG: DUF2628 domain-containing protein [Campylobacterota bacterium]|nr:DUF2628 domain-containing protein [Campylobacterota bacterium]
METENSDYENKMIEAFIDKPEKTFWYQNAFSKYSYNGVDAMQWHWSWWAFGGGFLFLLYRKQYMASLLLFIVSVMFSFLPFAGLVIMILSGGYGTFFVYKGYKKRKAEIEMTIESEEKRLETMRYVGGYHQWVVWVYMIFILFFMLGIASAIVIPSMIQPVV